MAFMLKGILALIIIMLAINVHTQQHQQPNLQAANGRVNSIPVIESTEHISTPPTNQASQPASSQQPPIASQQQPTPPQGTPNPVHPETANSIPAQNVVQNITQNAPQKAVQVKTASTESQPQADLSQNSPPVQPQAVVPQPNTPTSQQQVPPLQSHPSVDAQPQIVPEQSHTVPVQQHPPQQAIPSGSGGIAMHALSEQQKKKMLEQEALLTAFHKSESQDFSKFANMTAEQLKEFQRNMHRQAEEAYQNAIREMEEREKKERQEMLRLIEQEKVSKTQNISLKETLQFKDRQDRFNPRTFSVGKEGYFRHHFDQYMFQLSENDYEEFYITLTSTQEVALYSHTYQNIDGVYAKTEDIGDSLPPQIQIFADNYNLIASESFYFKTFMTFQGKEGKNYIIRVQNKGNPHLFSLSVVQLIDHNHISHTITTDHLHDHGPRAINIYEGLMTHIDHSHNMGLMSISNQHKLNKGISQYYIYNVVELGLIILFCLVQIKMIERLLASSSVV